MGQGVGCRGQGVGGRGQRDSVLCYVEYIG